jgi:uncharacterized short protein YbdD (DUF466 family)
MDFPLRVDARAEGGAAYASAAWLRRLRGLLARSSDSIIVGLPDFEKHVSEIRPKNHGYLPYMVQ